MDLDLPWQPEYADANSTEGKAIRKDLRRDLVKKNPRLQGYGENEIEFILRYTVDVLTKTPNSEIS